MTQQHDVLWQTHAVKAKRLDMFSRIANCLLIGLLGGTVSFAAGAEENLRPPKSKIAVDVEEDTPIPTVGILLGKRHAHGTPEKFGRAATSGGNIRVRQPSPDVVIITMQGGVAANGSVIKRSLASMSFTLDQEFKVVFAKLGAANTAKLYVETRLVGLLRGGHSHGKCGAAEQQEACAAITSGPTSLLSVCLEPYRVACGENQAINCQEGPVCVAVGAGCYTLHGTFQISATYERTCLRCKAAAADFNPGGLKLVTDHNPFAHCSREDFGFEIELRVVPE